MNFRELFFNKIFTLKNLFFISNFLVLFLFFYVLAWDYFREWKPFQKKYKRMEIERIKKMMAEGNEEVRNALKDELKSVHARALEVKQILASDLERVDRCITCHLGYDSFTNPALTNEFNEHPFAAPKNEIHTKHPFEKFGCTVCHGGQGLATTFYGAAHMPKDENQKEEWKKKHGWEVIEYWEHPMKAGPMIYASCYACHQSHPKVPGAEIVKKGQKLFFETGCIGCHQIRGEGGVIAPDLAEETASKPLARIDFGYAVTAGLLTKRERTLENWIRLHFTTAPSVLVPGDPEGKYSPNPKQPEPIAPSGMPDFGFSKEEAEALTAYVLSLRSEKIPYTYYLPAPKEPEPKFASEIQQGKYVYMKYGCAGCHGKNADKGVNNFNAVGGRVPDLTKLVGTYTREELKKRIQDGVAHIDKENPQGPTPPLYMPSWKEKIKGKELENLVSYLLSIAEKQEEW